MGKPTYQTGAITADAAADAVYVCREDDLLYWTTPPKFLATAAALAGTLQVTVRSYSYIAVIFGRMPSGIAVVTPACRRRPATRKGIDKWTTSTGSHVAPVAVPPCLSAGMPDRATRKRMALRMDQEAAMNRASIAREKAQAGGRRQLGQRIGAKVGYAVGRRKSRGLPLETAMAAAWASRKRAEGHRG